MVLRQLTAFSVEEEEAQIGLILELMQEAGVAFGEIWRKLALTGRYLVGNAASPKPADGLRSTRPPMAPPFKSLRRLYVASYVGSNTITEPIGQAGHVPFSK